ncbi:MAG: cysteine desulfurase [Calditrichaeota bacterium]|nr:cysteine desulfurase [Calditrichota bacterium]
MVQKNRFYFDYAANTPVDPEIRRFLAEFYETHYGNSAGIHHFARDMREVLDRARVVVAKAIGAGSSEIVFTSSATESNNMILKGLAHKYPDKNHIIISSVEHSSVFEVTQFLKTIGFSVSFIPVDQNGKIDADEIEGLIRPETLLVSVIWVNNELGTIQPLEEIGSICRQAGILFHTDAVQGFAKLPVNVRETNIDLLTASSHKIYGPLGAGMAYIKEGIKLEPLLHGGGHEDGKRSSTVNVPAIAAFAKAVELYQPAAKTEFERIKKFRQKIVQSVLESVPDSRINGDPDGLPHIINLSFKNVDGELLAIYLDRKGIAVSTGSACSTGKIRASRILEACNVSVEWRKGTIRISLGRFTTDEAVDYLIKELVNAVEKVRKIS